jgi:hypothetical protein
MDETRKDFDRVGWGGTEPPVHAPTPGVPRLVQLWFAGNHSDIGGSYPEPESRLSDIALHWMCEQAIGVPDGLKTGIFVDGAKIPLSGEIGTALNIYPAADGAQHCEVAGMHDTLDGIAAKLPRSRGLRLHRSQELGDEDTRHPAQRAPRPDGHRPCRLCPSDSVRERRALPAEALRDHDEFKRPTELLPCR